MSRAFESRARRDLAFSGLCLSELASIRVGDLRRDGEKPQLTLSVGTEKSRRGTQITIRRDLAYAGLAKSDDRGRTIDVHALRHTLRHRFGTLRAQSGATPKEAMLAMRHSKLELTLSTYADARLVDVILSRVVA